MSMMNTITLYATAVIFISAANSPGILAEKLVDLDTRTRAQLYSPKQPSGVPSLPSILPPFLQNLLPAPGKTGFSNAALPLFYTPQLVNLLSKDIFSVANHMLALLNTVLGLPPSINVNEQIVHIQKLMKNGQISEEYVPYATALISLLRDQPVLRALQESLSELQRSTSFNLSTSGQGLNDLKVKTNFNLPSTMITPSIQSSFGISNNPDDDYVMTESTTGSAIKGSGNTSDDNPFIFA